MLTQSDILFLIRILKKVCWLRVLSGGSDPLNDRIQVLIKKLESNPDAYKRW